MRLLFILVGLWILLPQSARGALFTHISPSQEVELGRRIGREVELKYPLSTDEVLQARVRRVGLAVVSAMKERAYPYDFKVLASSQVNAFCLPGGIIYIYEGLLHRLSNDDQLAFVIGHEMAHAAHRDYTHTQEKMEGVIFLGALASILARDKDASLMRMAVQFTQLRYSRKDENDADASAVEWAWNTGFSPTGALTTMDIFMTEDKGHGSPKYLLTHPPPKDRLRHIQEVIARLPSRPTQPERTPPSSNAVDTAATLVGDVSMFNIAANPWFPLSVGNEWTYEVTGESGLARYQTKVVSTLPTAQGPIYRLETQLGPSAKAQNYLLTTNTCVYRRKYAAPSEEKWRLDLETEVKHGAPIEVDGKRYELVAVESVTTPCGAFPEARKIRISQGDTPTMEVWLVSGIGLVKRVSLPNGITEMLIAYKTVPPASPVAIEAPH